MDQTSRIHLCSTDNSTCERLRSLFDAASAQLSFSRTAAEWDRFTADKRHLGLMIVATDFAAVHHGFAPVIAHAGLLHVPVIIVGEPPAPRELVRLARSGIVVDAITPPLDDEDLLASADAVLAETSSSTIATRMRSEREQQYGLTGREADVLDLIVSGESNKHAARLLGISHRTVEVHRARVMRKLGAHNTADLVARVTAWRTAPSWDTLERDVQAQQQSPAGRPVAPHTLAHRAATTSIV